LTARRFSGVDFGPSKFSWAGRVDGERSGFVSYGRVGDTITLTVSFSDGQVFSYRGEISTFSWSKVTHTPKECGGCTSSHDVPADPRSRAQLAYSWQDGDANLIDLMVVYPTAVRNEAGSTSAIQSDIMSAVADANLCYRNSQVNMIVRLVHMEEITYTPTGTLDTDLDRLKGTTDGYMDGIHSTRDQYGADLVALLTTDSDSGGLASTMSYPSLSFESSGFNVNVWDQIAAPTYTLAHEIGHNMGCLHNVENASNVGSNYVFGSFSYGKRWFDNGLGYRTVMSYDTQPASYSNKVPYFSNPNVLYQGTPTGEVSANNAQVLRSTSPYVANFRDSIVQGIVSSNYDIVVEEGNGSTDFGVRLAAKPSGTVEVAFSISGDEDFLLGSPIPLTFTPNTWNLQQTVSVLARKDTDAEPSTGTLVLSSSGIPSTSISLTEDDTGTEAPNGRLVSGVVANSLGVGIENVSIALSDGGGSTFTNSSGSFVLNVDNAWTGSITPTKENFNFAPISLEVSSSSGDSLGNSFEGNRSNILYVSTSASGVGDGSSWTNAFPDLADALRATVPYDEIWVASGTYKPGLVRSARFIVPSGKKLLGGFTGNEADESQRDPASNLTVLSGDIGIENDSSDNLYHVLIPSQDSLLDGFTISGGNASENYTDDDRGKGAALWAESTEFTVRNCVFTNNLSHQGGSAIYLKEANATFQFCTFSENDAGSSGSGGRLIWKTPM